MEQMVLIDPEQYPTDEVIFSHLGRAKNYWIKIFDHIHSNYPEISEEWRYYKDGKSWLLKVVRKKKTICWVSIIKNKFRMTFYFTDKAEVEIYNSKISDELKEQFKSAKYYNKIRGLTIVFSKNKDVEYAKEVIDIKLKMN